MPSVQSAARWWARASKRPALLVGVVLLMLSIHLGTALQRRSRHVGDFDISREFGWRFLAGEDLYAGGLHYPYLPVAGLWFAPLAMAPSEAAFVARYLVSVAALALALHLLGRLVRARLPALAGRHDVHREYTPHPTPKAAGNPPRCDEVQRRQR